MEHQSGNKNSAQWPTWAKNAVLYEVNVRQFTPEGTLTAFITHLPRLRALGVDILWFMPIFPISVAKRKGSLGSYYAVSNYTDVNPEIGTLKDFSQVVDKAHQLGMKVILDWVPNHTGWDHPWITQHPEFYTKDAAGNITDPMDGSGKSMGWLDVADLNYSNQEMRQFMISAMLFWVHQMRIDGFRQDMALLVPMDFWHESSQRLREVKPDIFLLAESETPEHVNAGCFHAIYSWSLHYILNQIALGKMNVNAISNWYHDVKPRVTQGSYMHFTSNHDENSWSGSEIERMGEAHQAFAVLVNMLDGIPLMYSGQEEPMPHRLKFFDKDDIGFKDFAYENFYTKLHQIKHENVALWNDNYGGNLVQLFKHNDVFAFKREKNGNQIIGFINLTKHKLFLDVLQEYSGIDLFTDKYIHIKKGSPISLKPWQYLIVKLQ